jgi:hypothetical protein
MRGIPYIGNNQATLREYRYYFYMVGQVLDQHLAIVVFLTPLTTALSFTINVALGVPPLWARLMTILRPILSKILKHCGNISVSKSGWYSGALGAAPWRWHMEKRTRRVASALFYEAFFCAAKAKSTGFSTDCAISFLKPGKISSHRYPHSSEMTFSRLIIAI